jgi:NAD(P)H-nitrite reductase large subunit
MLKVLGYDLYSIGQILTEDASYELIDTERDGQYFLFIFRDNHLIGAILLGDTTLSSAIKNVIEKKQDCSTLLQQRPGAEEVVAFLEEKS